MDTSQAHMIIGSIVPARIDLVLELSPDAWFAIAAIVTLWAYIMFAPGCNAQES